MLMVVSLGVSVALQMVLTIEPYDDAIGIYWTGAALAAASAMQLMHALILGVPIEMPVQIFVNVVFVAAAEAHIAERRARAGFQRRDMIGDTAVVIAEGIDAPTVAGSPPLPCDAELSTRCHAYLRGL